MSYLNHTSNQFEKKKNIIRNNINNTNNNISYSFINGRVNNQKLLKISNKIVIFFI